VVLVMLVQSLELAAVCLLAAESSTLQFPSLLASLRVLLLDLRFMQLIIKPNLCVHARL